MESEERIDQPAPVDDPNLPESGDDDGQFGEEAVPPSEVSSPEDARNDDTVDDQENPIDPPPTPAPDPQPGVPPQEQEDVNDANS